MTTTQQPYADLVKAAIDEAHDELVAVSKDIHAHPELNYQETYSSAALATALGAPRLLRGDGSWRGRDRLPC